MDASTTGRPVLVVPDLAEPASLRWPAARAAGLRAVFALPLQVGGIRLGFSICTPDHGMLPPELLAEATCAVSVRAGVSLGQALFLLRSRAYAEGRPLRELARDVLDGVVDMGGRRDHR